MDQGGDSANAGKKRKKPARSSHARSKKCRMFLAGPKGFAGLLARIGNSVKLYSVNNHSTK
jgi:hypothetical protein